MSVVYVDLEQLELLVQRHAEVNWSARCEMCAFATVRRCHVRFLSPQRILLASAMKPAVASEHDLPAD